MCVGLPFTDVPVDKRPNTPVCLLSTFLPPSWFVLLLWTNTSHIPEWVSCTWHWRHRSASYHLFKRRGLFAFPLLTWFRGHVHKDRVSMETQLHSLLQHFSFFLNQNLKLSTSVQEELDKLDGNNQSQFFLWLQVVSQTQTHQIKMTITSIFFYSAPKTLTNHSPFICSDARHWSQAGAAGSALAGNTESAEWVSK